MRLRVGVLGAGATRVIVILDEALGQAMGYHVS